MSESVMERNVIVAWDGSGPARAAVNWAARRQGSRPGTIQIIQVVNEAALRRELVDVQLAVSSAQEGLDEEARRARLLAPAATIVTEVLLGDPDHELRRLALPGSLLVVGAPHHGDIAPFKGWSLGARVAPYTTGALALIPEHVSGGRAGVLVGVNGSEQSMSAAVVAGEEALLRGEQLEAVHAWEPVAETGVRGLNPEFVAWLREANQDMLDDSLRFVEKKFPQLRIVRHLENDSTVRALRKHAQKAALVVVGTRGYGPVRRLLLGSVSHSLLLKMECPIIVVGEPLHEYH